MRTNTYSWATVNFNTAEEEQGDKREPVKEPIVIP